MPLPVSALIAAAIAASPGDWTLFQTGATWNDKRNHPLPLFDATSDAGTEQRLRNVGYQSAKQHTIAD
jgi:hypothetical protein